MPSLAELVQTIPQIKDVKLSAEGLALWLSGSQTIDPTAAKLLSDYGGLKLGEQDNQSLWLFLSADMFLSLAKLKIWADLNNTPMLAEIFDAELLIGLDMELGVKIPEALLKQNVSVPPQFKLRIQAKAIEGKNVVPGFTFTPGEALAGMSAGPWMEMSSDPRMLGHSTLGWYMVLKPLGDPLDKGFQKGWRQFFQQIENIISRLKLKYILHDNFLSFKLESIQDLRQWCQDYLKLVIEAKDIGPQNSKKGPQKSEDKENKRPYWPCVMALIKSAGVPFSNDLPKRVPLDWEIITPDFPHMSYRYALLLGPSFYINDARFPNEASGIDDWCSISLVTPGDRSGFSGVIPVELPRSLVIGTNQPCFYCGQRNHELTKCPTRELTALNPMIWRQIAQLNLSDIKDGLRNIDVTVKRQTYLPAIESLLKGEDTPARLTQAIFEITSLFQLRMMVTIWRSRGREYPAALRNLVPLEDTALLEALHELKTGNLLQADRAIAAYREKHPSSLVITTLHGFVSLEKGDLEKALGIWKDAEKTSHTAIHQAHHLYLQGRCLEISGKYHAAMDCYKTAVSRCRRWREGLYRQCICLTKMGFAEQSMQNFEEVIDQDANIFNRLLIDPEMERGHIQLRGMLYPEWQAAQESTEGTKENLGKFKEELSEWFDLKNDFSKSMLEKIEALSKMSSVNNFAAFRRLKQSRNELTRELQDEVSEQTSLLKEKFNAYLARLQDLKAEAAWFPFPKLLVDFNKNFNICARNCNWGIQQDFLSADTFRKATKLAKQSEEILGLLEGKLNTLKLLRDGTLFLLIIGKTFLWLEIIGLVCSLTLLPIGIYYGSELGVEWAKELLTKQKWQLQKGLVIILSIAALAISIIYATMSFERKRRALLNEDEKPSKKKGKK